jgi:hypothetical protein
MEAVKIKLLELELCKIVTVKQRQINDDEDEAVETIVINKDFGEEEMTAEEIKEKRKQQESERIEAIKTRKRKTQLQLEEEELDMRKKNKKLYVYYEDEFVKSSEVENFKSNYEPEKYEFEERDADERDIEKYLQTVMDLKKYYIFAEFSWSDLGVDRIMVDGEESGLVRIYLKTSLCQVDTDSEQLYDLSHFDDKNEVELCTHFLSLQKTPGWKIIVLK